MKNPPIDPWLLEYNTLLKDNDNIYRGAARRLGISDCALWILYSLRAECQPLTQKQLCLLMYLPKQTVNSALKAMEAEGYTEFTIGVEDDNEVAKHIYFKYGFADPIDHGDGDEFDPTAYTLYLRRK